MKSRHTRFLLIGFFSLTVLVTSLVTASSESIYFYVDTAGQSHYVTDIKLVPENYRDQLTNQPELPTISRVKSPKYEKIPFSVASRPGKVQILVATWCPHCRTLERFLKKNRVRFSKYDVERNSIGRNLYKQVGGGGVPVILIKGRPPIRGYDPAYLKSVLNLK